MRTKCGHPIIEENAGIPQFVISNQQNDLRQLIQNLHQP